MPKDPSGLTSCQCHIRNMLSASKLQLESNLPKNNYTWLAEEGKLEWSCRPQINYHAVLSLVDLDVTLRQGNHLRQNRCNLQSREQVPQMTRASMFPAEASSSQIMDLEPLRRGLVKHLSRVLN